MKLIFSLLTLSILTSFSQAGTVSLSKVGIKKFFNSATNRTDTVISIDNSTTIDLVSSGEQTDNSNVQNSPISVNSINDGTSTSFSTTIETSTTVDTSSTTLIEASTTTLITLSEMSTTSMIATPSSDTLPSNTMGQSLGTTQKKFGLFYPNWGPHVPSDLPISYLSDISYAFLNLAQQADGNYVPVLASQDTTLFSQFLTLKQQNKFSFAVAIGGWTYSTYFSLAVRTGASRTAFVNAITAMTQAYPGLIDQIDIDWEYVGTNAGLAGNLFDPSDATNFGLLLGMMKSALPNIKLSACVSAVPVNMDALPIQAMVTYLDSFKMMTYDFASSAWGACVSSFQANLYASSFTTLSINGSVNYLISKGVPSNLIQIGVPYYSRGFANTDGLGSPSSGTVSDLSVEAGVCDYDSLPRPGATEYFDSITKSSYSYDPIKRILNSYETVESAKYKAEYVYEMGLQGIFAWVFGSDYSVQDPRSLTANLAAFLNVHAAN